MQSTLRLMTHQPRDKKSPRRLNKHPIRMTRCRSRCGISQFESFTGDLSSRCASVLTRASRAVSRKWISTCNLAWSLWRWSHSELVGGCWVVTARFTQFVRGPRAVLQSIREPVHAPGHSPLGALSIIALLVSLLVQISTGLFANDDIFTEGPLAHWVTYETSRQLTAIHETNIWILGGYRTASQRDQLLRTQSEANALSSPWCRSPTRGSRVAGGRRYDGQAVLWPCPLWSNVCGGSGSRRFSLIFEQP